MGLGLATAFRTLTRFRVPGGDSKKESTSLFWFPAVGAFFASIDILLSLFPFPPMVFASLVMAFNAYATRGFHFDGLCDFADGFGGGYTKEETLSIMKDSHVGSFALIALSCALLVQFSTLSSLKEQWPVLLVVPMLSRTMQVVLAGFLPYAREGKGTAGNLVRQATWIHPVITLVQMGAVCYLLRSPAVLGSFLGAALVTLFLGNTSRKRIGGVTGDVLGATEVLSECFGYLCALAFSILFS